MVTTATAIAAGLWKGLRRIVERIGRWTIRTIVIHGARALASYMRQRVEVFRARLERVRKRNPDGWRVEFITGRIARWLAAARWLEAKADELADITERAIAPYLDKLPDESPWESPTAWRRMTEARG